MFPACQPVKLIHLIHGISDSLLPDHTLPVSPVDRHKPSRLQFFRLADQLLYTDLTGQVGNLLYGLVSFQKSPLAFCASVTFFYDHFHKRLLLPLS